MTRPQEEMSMEETRQQMALPTIMVVPYKKPMTGSYADILKNDFDLRIAVSTVKEDLLPWREDGGCRGKTVRNFARFRMGK